MSRNTGAQGRFGSQSSSEIPLRDIASVCVLRLALQRQLVGALSVLQILSET